MGEIENKQQVSDQKPNHIKVFNINNQIIPNKSWRQKDRIFKKLIPNYTIVYKGKRGIFHDKGIKSIKRNNPK